MNEQRKSLHLRRNQTHLLTSTHPEVDPPCRSIPLTSSSSKPS